MPARTSLAAMECSVARTLDLVGDAWSLLILRDALLGVRRFERFQARLGIARNVLSSRLDALVDNGVIERRPYQQRPLRHEYRLTERGKDLFGVIVALRQWGDRWLADGQPPLQIEHLSCGATAPAELCCSRCGGRLDHRNVRPVGSLVPQNIAR